MLQNANNYLKNKESGCNKMKLNKKKLFLMDMDGTIYLGNRLFDSTLPFFEYLTEKGAKYIFITNNSSKDIKQYYKKLENMNIPVTPECLITSTHATARYLKSRYNNKPIFASGTSAFIQELITSGLNITDDINTPISALVMGYDTELTFQKLENMCILLGREIDYIATNPDLICPTEYGYVPDCGSIAQILKNATGREPIFIGKPMPAMIEMALEQTGATKEETLIIGDRLYTDVACGIAAGVDTALVLSGESTEDDIKIRPYRPDYVFRDIGQLLENMKHEEMEN